MVVLQRAYSFICPAKQATDVAGGSENCPTGKVDKPGKVAKLRNEPVFRLSQDDSTTPAHLFVHLRLQDLM